MDVDTQTDEMDVQEESTEEELEGSPLRGRPKRAPSIPVVEVLDVVE